MVLFGGTVSLVAVAIFFRFFNLVFSTVVSSYLSKIILDVPKGQVSYWLLSRLGGILDDPSSIKAVIKKNIKKTCADSAYSMWDNDGNQNLSREEFRVGLVSLLKKSLGNVPDEQLNRVTLQILLEFDVDGDKHISKEEFKSFLSESSLKIPLTKKLRVLLPVFAAGRSFWYWQTFKYDTNDYNGTKTCPPLVLNALGLRTTARRQTMRRTSRLKSHELRFESESEPSGTMNPIVSVEGGAPASTGDKKGSKSFVLDVENVGDQRHFSFDDALGNKLGVKGSGGDDEIQMVDNVIFRKKP